MPESTPTRSNRLLAALGAYRAVLVVTHDNPDPDAMAAGWGLALLIRKRSRLPVRLVSGGRVIRAENRRMIDLLGPPVELVDRLDPGPRTAIVLVDCDPQATNHLVGRADLRPVAAVDHHQQQKRRPRLKFRDIRTNLAASASIVTTYLREQGVWPTVRLATALLYAIHTETQGQETGFSQVDRDAASWLTPRADLSLMAQITNAPLPQAYFADLALSLQHTFIYDRTGWCLLPRAEGAETVGEMADLLIRCDAIDRVLCGTAVGADVVLSARTDTGGGSAPELLRRTLEGIGRCGGHEHRAGGQIPDGAEFEGIREPLRGELRKRWLTACGADQKRGRRLVARDEILHNL